VRCSRPRTLRRWLAPAAATVLAAAILAGCGSSSSSSSSATATAAASTTPETPAAKLLPASIRSSGTLRIATEVGYAPFEVYEANGTSIEGLDVDLWNALAQRLGVKLKINDGTYADIIPALQAKRDDVGWSAMALVSFEGLKAAKFLVYANRSFNDLVVSSSDSSIKTGIDLCGKTLGYTNGESANTAPIDAQCKAAGKAPVQVKRFSKVPDIIVGIESGQVTGRIADAVNGHYFVTTSGGKLRYVENIFPTKVVPTGIAVPVDQPQLLQALQTGLQELIDDGTYQKILAKWNATAVGVKQITVDYAYKSK
jgi:polar amino acid transport system substrate-binding protein